MEPAAVLAVVVKARGIVSTNSQLKSVQANLAKAEAAGASFGTGLQKSSSRAATAGAAMSGAGRKINRGVGLPLLAISALSAKAAIDFEDSFASVRKTVNATEPQFAKMETGIRGLAQSIPISVHELNELGGSAGALGIKRKALLPFIKTAAELGTTTDLSSDEASNALARISNVMGTSEKDFRRLGSTFVDLGNKGASTEQEIANMALRIVGAGKLVGLSESEVLAFSSALASVGVRAEAGGSAISKVFSEMALNVANGSKKVNEFARVAGMGRNQFSALFKKDAGEAMIEFIEGLDKIRKQGGNVYGVLENLELKDIRIRDSLLRAAGAGKLFREQLKIGSSEWRQNNALTQEARKRYGTTASQIQLAKNEIYDFAITLGQNLLPVVADVLHMISGLTGWLDHLPVGVQQNILKFIALTVTLGIVLSLLGKLVTAYAQIPKAIAYVTGANAAAKLSNDALAASYAETALAAEVSAESQIASAAKAAAANKAAVASNQMSMLMPDAGPAGQMSLLGTTPPPPPSPAPAAVAKEATKTSRFWSSSFVMGIARFVPPALALIGLGSILSSVMGGDTEGAAFKTGGAAAGALAGGIAFGLPGALAGAGIGAIVGGFVGDLFGDGDGITAWQQHIKETTGRVKTALESQRISFRTVGLAQDRLTDIGRRQAKVSGHVKAAEDRLSTARKNHRGGAPEVRRAEEALAHWKGKEVRLVRRQWHWETLLSGARARSKQHSRQLRTFEVDMIRVKQAGVESAKRQARQSMRTLETHTREGATLKVLTEDEERLLRKRAKSKKAIQAREEWEKRLGATMKEITKRYGPAYADQLRKQIPLWHQTREQLKQSEAAMRRLAPGITPITAQMRKFGERGSKATKDVRKGVVGVKEVMGPFQSESNTQLGKAQTGMKSWKKTSVLGVSTVENKLGGFAGELGFKDIGFGVKQKAPKKQAGGVVVPGTGTGDKVPLTAMVEPGEVVHVLNMRASKDREKLGQLEAHNKAVPRFPHRERKFAAGGVMVDPAGPGTGVVNKAIADVVGRWSTTYQAAINYGYDPGGGHLSPGHNITGTATDTGPAAGWEVGTPLFERGLRSLVGKVDQILYGSHGIGEAYPNHGWGNHAHIEWGMHPDVQGMLGAMVKKIEMTGPSGALKEVGQGVFDSAVAMANQKLKQMGGMGGGADTGFMGTGKIVGASTYAPDAYTGTVGAAGKSLIGTMSFAELGMGQNLGGLPFGGKLRVAKGARSVIGEKLDIGLGGGDVEGHRRDIDLWYQMAEALGLPGQPHPGWLGTVEVSDPMKKLQAGGTATASGKGAQSKPIAVGIKNVLQGLSKGKHLPKYQAQLKKLRRRIDGIGISGSRLEKLGDTTKDIEKYAEYASNASAMTLQNEDGSVTQGLFRGREEGGWLNDQLGALMKLRKELIGVHGTVEGKQLPRVDKLMKDSRKRLQHVRKVIRDAEEKKRDLEKKVKENEQAAKQSKQAVEKEIKELETKLDKAGNAKNPNKGYMEQLRGEIHTKKDAISGGDKKTQEEIKDMREKIKGIDKANAGRKRVEGALTGTIIPGFEAQHTGMHETLANLFSDGGEVKGTSFTGLRQIQGLGGTLDEVPNPPPYGLLGGEVFSVQDRLRTIKEEMERVPSVSETAESESATVAREMMEEWRKRYMVSQAQFKVLQDMPGVAATQVPFAGAYAKGGVVAAEVGERGREIAVMPQGARVVPSHEAQAALASSGDTSLNFEQLNVYEDGSVTGRVNGQDFDAKFKKATKKIGGRPRTPGGR